MNKIFSMENFTSEKNPLNILGKSKGYAAAVKSGIDLAEAYIMNNKGSLVKGYGLDVEKVADYDNQNMAFYTLLFRYVYEDDSFVATKENLAILKNPKRFNTAQHERYYDVINSVETTIAPKVTEMLTGSYNEVRNIANGDTAEFDIESNEIFVADTSAEGVPFGGSQKKFNTTVTINPTPLNITFDTDWYLVASGKADFGKMFYKASLGFTSWFTTQAYNKILELALQVPASYKFVGFTTENIDLCTMAVSGANNGIKSTIIGTLPALRNILPNNDFLKAAVGRDWIEQGYVGEHANSPLFEMTNLINPVTINTNVTAGAPDFLFRNDIIFVMPFVGVRPVKTVFEGDMFNITLSAIQTADKTERASLTYRVGVEFVYSQIVGVITAS